MGEPREHRYLRWLESQIATEKEKNFHELFEILHSKEFIWIVPNDDNRVEDGLEIRFEFYRRHNALSRGCSVLEVIIGLSRRLAFAAGGNQEDWAWQIIENLELHKMSGHIGKIRSERIEEILETLIWRNYLPNGQGGFFPLAWSEKDQRRIEIWYQMCAYIDEIVEL